MAENRTRIVEVAASLLREHGAAGVTTRAVAEGAGVQAPTLYRLFGDKDGLLDAVAEHAMATFVAAKADTAAEAADADVDPVHDLRRGWDTYVDFGLANPTLAVLVTDPARSRSPAVRAGLEVLTRRVHRIGLAGRLRVPEARAVALVHAAGTGAVLTLLAAPADQRERAAADDLFEAVLGAIVVDAGPGAAPQVTAAVTLRAAVPDTDVLTAAEQALFAEWLDRLATRA